MEFSEQDMKKEPLPATDNDTENFTEGVYLCRVGTILERTSKGGDPQWAIRFEEAESGETICWDNLTFGTASRGIAYQKLTQLGVTKDKNGIYKCDPKELENREVTLSLVENTYMKDGSLRVDGGPPHFGYELTDVPF